MKILIWIRDLINKRGCLGMLIVYGLAMLIDVNIPIIFFNTPVDIFSAEYKLLFFAIFLFIAALIPLISQLLIGIEYKNIVAIFKSNSISSPYREFIYELAIIPIVLLIFCYDSKLSLFSVVLLIASYLLIFNLIREFIFPNILSKKNRKDYIEKLVFTNDKLIFYKPKSSAIEMGMHEMKWTRSDENILSVTSVEEDEYDEEEVDINLSDFSKIDQKSILDKFQRL